MSGIADRVVGCIVGGAIGDAMGGPYEGQPAPVTVQPDAPWRLSDDTQLTLATCEAVVAAGAVSPDTIASRFVQWYRQGRVTGVGASTLKALRDLDAGAHWALAGRAGERGAGNGAAMRVAPLAFCLDPGHTEDRTLLRDICRITHHNDEAYAGALAIVGAVRAMALGVWQPGANLASHAAALLRDTSVRDRLLALAALDRADSVAEIACRFGCSGFVVESVPLAIFAAQRIQACGIHEVLADVIKTGGDTDTIASMAGQIAGASIGQRGIPARLIEQLPDREEILHVAQGFAAHVQNQRA